MIISRKSIFRTAVFISLTIVTLVYGVTYSIFYRYRRGKYLQQRNQYW